MTRPEFDADSEQRRLEQAAASYSNPETASITDREAEHHAASQSMDLVCGPDVLMLGAATGVWVDLLLDRFARFEVVDAVESMVRDMEHRFPGRIAGHVALFEHFQPESLYDTVILGHVLEHVQDPVGLLKSCGEWLKPRGRLVILVPNSQSLHRLIGVQLGYLARATDFSPADLALGHRRVYDRETLIQDVVAAGLEVIHFEGSVLKPLSNAQMDQWTPELRRAYMELGTRLQDFACVLICAAARPDAEESGE